MQLNSFLKACSKTSFEKMSPKTINVYCVTVQFIKHPWGWCNATKSIPLWFVGIFTEADYKNILLGLQHNDIFFLTRKNWKICVWKATTPFTCQVKPTLIQIVFTVIVFVRFAGRSTHLVDLEGKNDSEFGEESIRNVGMLFLWRVINALPTVSSLVNAHKLWLQKYIIFFPLLVDSRFFLLLMQLYHRFDFWY